MKRVQERMSGGKLECIWETLGFFFKEKERNRVVR